MALCKVRQTVEIVDLMMMSRLTPSPDCFASGFNSDPGQLVKNDVNEVELTFLYKSPHCLVPTHTFI